ncbi:MAG: L,D-transpeptidase family protein [Gammaproteobacteria bacterium]|nr:L,D-transpeptidase family protein [Gammaproteobacteria bacterium]
MAPSCLYHAVMHRALICLLFFFAPLPPAAVAGDLPAYLLRVPASVKTAFVAETATAKFHRFDNSAGGGLRYVGNSYMSIGINGDGKQRSGDRRTPLGVYFVTEQLDTSRMHEKYGGTAFVLDYPNAWDQRLDRSGDGIWVHGVDRRGGKRPLLDTDGCIALPNEELASLILAFEANKTPVVIAREVRWLEEQKLDALRAELTSSLDAWARTLELGEIDDHLSLYDDEFRHWGMDRTEWGVLQRTAIPARAIDAVDLGELLLLADPEQDGLFLSRFQLLVNEASGTTAFTKRLYWRRAANGELKIVAEDAG